MLELRPNCECCDQDLPPGDATAFICSFECTYCAACVKRLGGRCPNCGGELLRRPIRPAAKRATHPPSAIRVRRASPCFTQFPEGETT